jgi:hypothetical protein
MCVTLKKKRKETSEDRDGEQRVAKPVDKR